MRAVLALALAASATAFKSGLVYKNSYESYEKNRRVLQGLADLIPEDGPDPGPIPTFDDGGDDDTFVCDAPAGCPCLSGALDTFTDDDVTMQPQLYSCADNAACRKRPIGLLRFLDTDLPEGLAEMAMVILFAWLLGGIIGAANRSGGMAALGPLVIGYIKDSFLSQLITFFFGFLIFMDDYGNTLIVGNTIRPITDTMRLSREELSFLVDCTSAPIASIVPVSTWVSFELALINQAIKSIGYDSESAYTLFLNSIGKSFYAWYTCPCANQIHGACLLDGVVPDRFDRRLHPGQGLASGCFHHFRRDRLVDGLVVGQVTPGIDETDL